MADYWKSNPRKHCDFCDCWIADNKPSIDFHERGKRHQENVEKKIAELRKKGLQQHKEQQEFEGNMKRIEEEALKKFQQDVANDPVLSAKYKALQAKSDAISKQKEEASATSSNESQNIPSQQRDGTERLQAEVPLEEPTQQVWYEGTTEDGRLYYWNSVTQESLWEKPPDFDGLSTVPDPQDLTDKKSFGQTTEDATDNGEEDVEEEEEEEESAIKNQDDEDSLESATDRRPVKRKTDSAAYGSWSTVETVEPVDLQLPGDRQVFLQHTPRVAEKKPKDRLKFKEKTVTSLATSRGAETAQVGFKKRKFGGNVRKRDKDA